MEQAVEASSGSSAAEGLWMRCRKCGRSMMRISVIAGWTCLELFGGQVIIRAADVTCACGAVRRFLSAPIPAAEIAPAKHMC